MTTYENLSRECVPGRDHALAVNAQDRPNQP